MFGRGRSTTGYGKAPDYGRQRQDGQSPPLTRWLEGLMSNVELPNVAKELVHPGKDPLELLMRTVLKDPAEANDAVMFLHKLKKFDLLEEYRELILGWLASRVAIKGVGRLDYLQASIGILAPVLRAGYGGKVGADSKKRRDSNQGEE